MLNKLKAISVTQWISLGWIIFGFAYILKGNVAAGMGMLCMSELVKLNNKED